jgi:hypothetical protein
MPAALYLVEHEYDSSLPGASTELAPAIDRPEQVFKAAKEVSRARRTPHQTSYLLIGASSQ